jgi:segregation and condensation protein A
MSEYVVTTEKFSGPLNTLLDLIDEKKLSINEISLSGVADDFIRHMQSANLSKQEVAQFLFIATTLMLIKSVTLLPGLAISDEEKHDIDELERRLFIYKEIKNLAKEIDVLHKGTTRMYFSRHEPETLHIFSPHKGITIENLKEAIVGVLAEAPLPEDLIKAKVEKVMSLPEMIDNLSGRIKEYLSVSFNTFSGKDSTGKLDREKKLNIIVSFLAMLELVKQELVDAKQGGIFSDITIETLPHES